MNKKVLLMILDGWGIGAHDKTNAIYMAGQPNIDALRAKYPHSELQACGEDVGLPKGQMGNSEVGHLNIGAGRIIYQPLEFISKSIRDKSFYKNTELLSVMDHVKKNNSKLHIFGLLSDG